MSGSHHSRLPVMRRASMLEDAREKEKRTWMTMQWVLLQPMSSHPSALSWDVKPASDSTNWTLVPGSVPRRYSTTAKAWDTSSHNTMTRARFIADDQVRANNSCCKGCPGHVHMKLHVSNRPERSVVQMRLQPEPSLARPYGLDLNLIERTFSFQPSRTFRGNCNQCPGPPRNFLETTLELQGKPYGTHQNLAENCTGTFPKPCRTFLGTAREPVRNLPEPPTVGELTLDLSPPERNFSNRPEPPFELPAKPTGTLPGTAREPVWNLPEPSWELHRNLSKT